MDKPNAPVEKRESAARSGASGKVLGVKIGKNMCIRRGKTPFDYTNACVINFFLGPRRRRVIYRDFGNTSLRDAAAVRSKRPRACALAIS